MSYVITFLSSVFELFLTCLSRYLLYYFRKDVTMEMVNMHEKQLFMDGKKLVAVISEAGSAGVSLQADRRAANQVRQIRWNSNQSFVAVLSVWNCFNYSSDFYSTICLFSFSSFIILITEKKGPFDIRTSMECRPCYSTIWKNSPIESSICTRI